MIRFNCSHCRTELKATEDLAGRKSKCTGCGQFVAIPGPPVAAPPPLRQHPSPSPIDFEQTDGHSEISAQPQPKPRLQERVAADARTHGTDRRERRRHSQPSALLLLRLAGLGILVAVVFVAGAWSAFTVIGPPARKPATCKELAERLRGQGLSIEWEVYRHQSGMPSIVVFDHAADRVEDARKGDCNHIREHGWELLKEGEPHYVVITQYPTEELAEEQAGSDQNAWSYGRFLVWGWPGRFRDQVKAELRAMSRTKRRGPLR